MHPRPWQRTGQGSAKCSRDAEPAPGRSIDREGLGQAPRPSGRPLRDWLPRCPRRPRSRRPPAKRAGSLRPGLRRQSRAFGRRSRRHPRRAKTTTRHSPPGCCLRRSAASPAIDLAISAGVGHPHPAPGASAPRAPTPRTRSRSVLEKRAILAGERRARRTPVPTASAGSRRRAPTCCRSTVRPYRTSTPSPAITRRSRASALSFTDAAPA